MMNKRPTASTKQFRLNYYNLRDSIKKNQAKADSDSAALAHDHDRRIRPPAAETAKGCPRWDGSDAQQLLMEDVDAGLTNSLKPSKLQQTRTAYKAFSLEKFRDHIYQEQRSRTEKSYWKNRQQKAEK